MFVGVVLLFALALTNFDRSLDLRSYLARRRENSGKGGANPSAPAEAKA